MAKEKFDIAKMVSDKLIAALEAEIEKGDDARVVWRKPWSGGALAQNLNSKREYRGFVNQFFLMLRGFDSPYWNTYEGWREYGYRQWAKTQKDVKIEEADISSVRSKRGKYEKMETWIARQTENVQKFFAEGGAGVKQGEKCEYVTYNARVPNKKYDEDDKESGPKYWWMLRYYKVFNAEQTFGCAVPKPNPDEIEFTPIEAAERVWEAWEKSPPVEYKGARACYIPKQDEIKMPRKNSFKSREALYKTLFHEGVHATGHEDRLARKEIMELGAGTDKMEKYSFEELTAEMGACILAAHCGLPDTDGDSEENSVAYMRGWIKRLKDDTKLAVKASTKAAAACDHILGVTYENDDDKKEGE